MAKEDVIRKMIGDKEYSPIRRGKRKAGGEGEEERSKAACEQGT